ncbi:MAG: hypothetical protein IPG58_06005 [Acidobacteria bacterium]|nr:hypothetical protein [Acidobacteriota bacterium]
MVLTRNGEENVNKIYYAYVHGVLFFAFTITIGAIARPAFAQCEKVTDSQIVASIYAKIKNDKGLAPQISHINVVSVYAAVKFQGWADRRADYDRIVGFASETTCVRLVNVNNFAETPPAAGNALRAAAGCARGDKSVRRCLYP